MPRTPDLIISSAVTEWNEAQINMASNRAYCLNLLGWSKPDRGMILVLATLGELGLVGSLLFRHAEGCWINGFQANYRHWRSA